MCNMIFNREIKIGNRTVSDESAVFIIAEAGVNHNSDMELAKRLVDVAVEAGADAVKFQTFRAEHLILSDIPKAPYQQVTTDKQATQYQMLKGLEVSHEQNLELVRYCVEKGIIFLTTPFESVSLDSLDSLDLPAYKIASTDTTNLPFLIEVAKKGKPIILSTGMSYYDEILLALKEIYTYNKDVVLLQCTADYPITDTQANIAVLDTFREKLNILTGYSDHTTGVGAGPFSVIAGAKVIEKHFTLDKNMKGPDHRASLSIDELKDFVAMIRLAEKYLGSGVKIPTVFETQTRASLQKSLVASDGIKKGELFALDNITSKRAGGKGVSPLYYRDFVGKEALRDYEKDELLELR